VSVSQNSKVLYSQGKINGLVSPMYPNDSKLQVPCGDSYQVCFLMKNTKFKPGRVPADFLWLTLWVTSHLKCAWPRRNSRSNVFTICIQTPFGKPTYIYIYVNIFSFISRPPMGTSKLHISCTWVGGDHTSRKATPSWKGTLIMSRNKKWRGHWRTYSISG
jgi:hypothetical protein